MKPVQTEREALLETHELLTRAERSRIDKILLDQGISLVPRVRGTKSPPTGFLLLEHYNGKIANLDEISKWEDLDRAAICGVHNLIVFDFDSLGLYELFWEKKNVDRIAGETFTVKTARGVQNWFFDLSLDASRLPSTINVSLPNPEDSKNDKSAWKAEIFIRRHMSACPGNMHPSGITYELVGTSNILRKDGIFDQALQRFHSLHCSISSTEISSYADSQPINPGSLGLTDWQMSELTSILAQLWFEGGHHTWIISSAGWLLRLHVQQTQAASFLSTLAAQLGCKTREHTAGHVSRQIFALYKSADKGKRIPGLTSLLELAKLHYRDDLVEDLLDLNKIIRRRRESVSSV
jgi:hypothetical protein